MPTASESMIVHVGQQRDEVVAATLAGLRGISGLRFGGTAFLPKYKTSTAQEKLDIVGGGCDYALADPQTERMEGPLEKRGYGRAHLLYLQREDPGASPGPFVDEVLTAQAQLGRHTVISPWLTHGHGVGQKHLRATRRFAMEAANHPLAKSCELLLGVAVAGGILADSNALDDFLDELVDWPDGPIYLRVVTSTSPSYEQLRDTNLLIGLRRLVESLTSNERIVLLPLSGLAGWLMMPFGARAFGTGISASLQRLGPPRGGGGGGDRLRWYFLPELLGFVLHDELRLFSSLPGYTVCGCPFCAQLPLDRAGGDWDFDTAGQHYLHCCGQLCASLSTAAQPRVQLQRRLGRAQSFWQMAQSAGVVVDSRSVPRHLAAWIQAVG